MREGISVVAIFQIVIIFILLFTAIMAMTINNANAFGVKDEIVNAIEANNGKISYNENGGLGPEIVNPMREASYRMTGSCPDGFTGYDRNGNLVYESDKAAICLRLVEATNGIDRYYYNTFGNKASQGDLYCGYYYQVVVFYRIDIPIINQIYNLYTKGETKIFYDQINQNICPK